MANAGLSYFTLSVPGAASVTGTEPLAVGTARGTEKNDQFAEILSAEKPEVKPETPAQTRRDARDPKEQPAQPRREDEPAARKAPERQELKPAPRRETSADEAAPAEAVEEKPQAPATLKEALDAVQAILAQLLATPTPQSAFRQLQGQDNAALAQLQQGLSDLADAQGEGSPLKDMLGQLAESLKQVAAGKPGAMDQVAQSLAKVQNTLADLPVADAVQNVKGLEDFAALVQKLGAQTASAPRPAEIAAQVLPRELEQVLKPAVEKALPKEEAPLAAKSVASDAVKAQNAQDQAQKTVAAQAQNAVQAVARQADAEAAEDMRDAAPAFLNIAQSVTPSTGGAGAGDAGADAQGEAPLPLAPQAPTLTLVRAPQESSTFTRALEHVQQAAQPSPAEQLQAHVRAVAKNGDSHIQIKLKPAELGTLDIRLEVNAEGSANLKVTADNPRTLELLRSDSRVLERMLTDIGLKADAGSLSFNLRDEGGQAQQQNMSGENGSHHGHAYRHRTVDAVEEALAAVPAQSYLLEPDGLDIHI